MAETSVWYDTVEETEPKVIINNLKGDELTFNLLLIGNSGVGKTSLIERVVNDQFNPTVGSTVGVYRFTHRALIGNDITIVLHIWDTAGQERYRSLMPNYYRKADAVILVYDITDIESFNSLSYWINNLSLYCDKSLNQLVMAIAGNKSDFTDLRRVDAHEAQVFAKDHHLEHIETSAKTSSNTELLFKFICLRLLNTRNGESFGDEMNDNTPVVRMNPIDLSQKQLRAKSDGKCCH